MVQRTHVRVLLQAAHSTGDLDAQTDALLALLDSDYIEHQLNERGHTLQTLGDAWRVWRASCAAGELDLVTRVAVTVRTATFYTRTKIRKLAAPSSDRDVIVAAALRVLDLFELDRPIRLLGCG